METIESLVSLATLPIESIFYPLDLIFEFFHTNIGFDKKSEAILPRLRLALSQRRKSGQSVFSL
jgi:hypothetical protein